jgi:hypothetical protein
VDANKSHLPTMTNNQTDIKHYESVFDSVAHELIMLLREREKELGLEKDYGLTEEYYVFRDKLQKKAQELYPDYNFENF